MATELTILNFAFRPLSDEDVNEPDTDKGGDELKDDDEEGGKEPEEEPGKEERDGSGGDLDG